MQSRKHKEKGRLLEISVCIAVVVIVASLCYIGRSALSYRSDALILLLTVSVLAMFYDMWPVIIAAVLSAGIWNFFFIPPTFTLHIGSTEDALMFLMYFIIAILNAVLTIQIKRERKKLQKKEEEAMVIRLYNTVFNSLSHELKTPIATIIGSADMLESDAVELSPKQQQELVHEIGIAGQRLDRQINNLLHMSRLDSGVLRPKNDWCDLEEMIHQLIHSFNDSKRIVFEPFTPMPLFLVDQFWLEVILQNLLLNALHYSPEVSPVRLKIIQVSPELELVVSDQGKGIPEYDLERVFDKFFRLPNSGTQGSGIGLSIVKGYTEGMGGRVFAQNNESGGADFVVRIPLEVSYLNQLQHE